jgi:hypothetical protein
LPFLITNCNKKKSSQESPMPMLYYLALLR